MNGFKVTSGFTIRGIDPRAILDRYTSGFYSNRHLKTKDETRVETLKIAPINIIPLNDSTVDDDLYVYKDRHDKIRINVFTNQNEYKHYISDTPIDSRECLNCRNSFNHEPIRIPISRKLVNVGGTVVLIYYGHGYYCDCRCALSALVRERSQSYRYRNSAMTNSEMYLREIYRYITGSDKKLVRANDVMLLKKFGGSLDYPDWKGNTYIESKDNYIKPKIISVPMKGVYNKIMI